MKIIKSVKWLNSEDGNKNKVGTKRNNIKGFKQRYILPIYLNVSPEKNCKLNTTNFRQTWLTIESQSQPKKRKSSIFSSEFLLSIILVY